MQDVHSQLAAAGLVVDGVLEIGKMVRCRAEGDKGSKRSGWYVLHELRLDSGETVLVGRYGNWKLHGGDALKIEFSGTGLSEAERERFKAEQQRLRAAAAEEKKQRAEEAARRAARIFPKLPDSGTSPYLNRKKVRAFGVRFSYGSIVVPVRSIAGDLAGLQFIAPDGEKKFLTGTAKAGCFHLIGEVNPRAPLLIAEGYATAASLHIATQFPVVVAFDAGNLLPVAKAWREAMPDQEIIVAADNDADTEGNPGITKGRAAALAIGAQLCWPEFEARVAA